MDTTYRTVWFFGTLVATPQPATRTWTWTARTPPLPPAGSPHAAFTMPGGLHARLNRTPPPPPLAGFLDHLTHHAVLPPDDGQVRLDPTYRTRRSPPFFTPFAGCGPKDALLRSAPYRTPLIRHTPTYIFFCACSAPARCTRTLHIPGYIFLQFSWSLQIPAGVVLRIILDPHGGRPFPTHPHRPPATCIGFGFGATDWMLTFRLPTTPPTYRRLHWWICSDVTCRTLQDVLTVSPTLPRIGLDTPTTRFLPTLTGPCCCCLRTGWN